MHITRSNNSEAIMADNDNNSSEKVFSYSATTDNIKVTAVPNYLEDESEPKEGEYVWNYNIHIENLGEKKLTLASRHWVIIDGKGQVNHVHGEGVVGQTPTLEPHQGFEYTSGTKLSTPLGMMMGKYHMLDEDGQSFEVTIPTFSLHTPDGKKQLH